MTLRARLLLALVVLLAFAVVVTNVAAVTALRSYMLAQVDAQLKELPPPVMTRISPQPGITNDTRPERGNGGPHGGRLGFNELYIQVRDADGTIQSEYAPLVQHDDEPAPHIAQAAILAHDDGKPFTVGAEGKASYKYRVIVANSLGGNGTVTVATPLASVEKTVMKLVSIDVSVTIVVMLVLILIGWFVIRSDLQPLEHMANTAGAIAAGDLSQRVERADHTTEVGRLGTALNTMLGQIESSFAQRRASEDRLRRFAADASHELRTPITSIRGYAELYRAGALDDPIELQRVMSRIESESQRMGLLVEDLLLLARLDQGRPLEQNNVDLIALASDAVSDARVTSPERDITLDAPDSLIVKGDGPRLHQVITNLLSNALRHTPDGTPVHVELRTDESSAVLRVRDDGPGLRAEETSKVFERFYRVDAGRARTHGGSGLGLAIVQSLVAAHGGTTEVESVPGEGATFIVRLPTAEQGASVVAQ